MGEISSIQWTDATWNPWHGCHKVSAGCKNCYMFRDKERYGQEPNVVMRSKGNFQDPLKWEDPKLIFTCSWSDFFVEEADAWREEAWNIIRLTPQHTYQILTKRPERIQNHLPVDWGAGYDNVWIGVSVEDQDNVWRADELLRIPAKVYFLSLEPLLGHVSFEPGTLELFHWAIIGGESGNNNGRYRYRRCEKSWILALILKCDRARVPVFVKQLGTHMAMLLSLNDRHGGNWLEWDEPALFRREMPEAYRRSTGDKLTDPKH